MADIIVLGNLFDSKNETHANGRVYDIKGLAPAIASSNFGHEKWILDIRKVDLMNDENRIVKSRAEQSSLKNVA
ncbi:MAG: hypothetical protein KBT03_08035 [Bacteroidales bacterium]|nr:hypothetical protein [Candidatus Scybalousia scybalohippi]